MPSACQASDEQGGKRTSTERPRGLSDKFVFASSYLKLEEPKAKAHHSCKCAARMQELQPVFLNPLLRPVYLTENSAPCKGSHYCCMEVNKASPTSCSAQPALDAPAQANCSQFLPSAPRRKQLQNTTNSYARTRTNS